MPQSTVSPFHISDAQSATSVGSASSLLISSDSESVREKEDCMNSMRNGYSGSFSTLTHQSIQNAENEQKLRAESIKSEDFSQLGCIPFLKSQKYKKLNEDYEETKEESETDKSDLPNLKTENDKKDKYCKLEEGLQKKRHSLKSENFSQRDCLSFLKSQKCKKLDEEESETVKSDLPSLETEKDKKNEYCNLEEGLQKKRHSSLKSEDFSQRGCMSFLKSQKCKKLDAKDAKSSKITARQIILLFVLSLATLSSSFAICLFPPFFPQIAEKQGATASVYGFIIGTNCLASFLITPFIGKNLKVIGVRFAFVSGVFAGGVCCFLSGFLEFFPPGMSFIVISICIRIVHAAGNAGAITSTFTYTAVEFPNSVAKIFSFTRTMMNIAQLAGPIAGGALYEWGGFKAPFLIMGSLQTVMAFAVLPFLPDYDDFEYEAGSKSTSSLSMLCIPTIWIPFLTFVVSTMANGFLSINLEPQVLRTFGLSHLYVGVFFGLKDGFNSVASPIWGILCDRRGSVKVCLIVSTLLGALSIFLIGPFPYVPIDRNLAVVGVALALSGIAFAGQQVSGVVDAMREAVNAGYPDSPSTHGLVAGLWSSLSGAGRFVSRSGTGILVDHIGFQMTAVIVFAIQLLVGIMTFWCTMPRCRRRREFDDEEELDTASIRSASFAYSVVDAGENPRLTITQPESPADSVTCRSLSIPLPRDCDVVRRLRAETYAGSTAK